MNMCPSCRSINTDDAKSCFQCGTELAVSKKIKPEKVKKTDRSTGKGIFSKISSMGLQDKDGKVGVLTVLLTLPLGVYFLFKSLTMSSNPELNIQNIGLPLIIFGVICGLLLLKGQKKINKCFSFPVCWWIITTLWIFFQEEVFSTSEVTVSVTVHESSSFYTSPGVLLTSILIATLLYSLISGFNLRSGDQSDFQEKLRNNFGAFLILIGPAYFGSMIIIGILNDI